MKIPIAPIEEKLVDENGYITEPGWLNFFSQHSQQGRAFLGDEGYTMPSMDKDKLKSIEEKKVKSIAYSDTSEKAVANNSGKFEEIQTAPELTSDEITDYAKRSKKSSLVNNKTDNNMMLLNKSQDTGKPDLFEALQSAPSLTTAEISEYENRTKKSLFVNNKTTGKVMVLDGGTYKNIIT